MPIIIWHQSEHGKTTIRANINGLLVSFRNPFIRKHTNGKRYRSEWLTIACISSDGHKYKVGLHLIDRKELWHESRTTRAASSNRTWRESVLLLNYRMDSMNPMVLLLVVQNDYETS